MQTLFPGCRRGHIFRCHVIPDPDGKWKISFCDGKWKGPDTAAPNPDAVQ